MFFSFSFPDEVDRELFWFQIDFGFLNCFFVVMDMFIKYFGYFEQKIYFKLKTIKRRYLSKKARRY
jgi:hypothetical protein